MRRTFAAIVLLAGTLTTVGINVNIQTAAAATCPTGTATTTVTWGASGLIQWPNDADHSSPSWYDTYTNVDGDGLDLTIGMNDADSRNEDLTNALIDTLNGTGYPLGYDAPFYTMTDGVFGAGYLSAVMNSENVDEIVNWGFSFTKPVYVPDFRVDDIDSIGFGTRPTQEPHESFQDEVELYADRQGTPVGFDANPLGTSSPVAIGPTSFVALYEEGVDNNVSPEDAAGQIEFVTTEPITSFSFDYSNGPDESLFEPSATYPPQVGLDPNGDGHSNNHGVRLGAFSVCTGLLSIGETVFADYDGDGVEEPGEPGLAGVTVTLYDNIGQVMATTTTDANGDYLFEDILPWDGWTVAVTPPADHTNTGDLDGGDDGIAVVDTSAGVDRLDADFALRPPPASISGSVYSDPNNDGLYNPAESDTGVQAVEVTLSGTDRLGNAVNTTTITDANGDYTFADLLPGDYTITETQPAGYDDGIDTPGTLASANGNDSFTVSLNPGDSSIDNNFFEIPDASIAGSVYEDLNNNGVQDGAESGISGASVTLTGTDDGGNAVNYSATTDANGDYLFDNLRAGDYTITETQPAGYFDGTDTAGSEGGNTATDDVISAIALPPTTDATGYTFGELLGSSISGDVYDDFGTPIAGVVINLTGVDIYGGAVTLSTTTAPDGSYSFTGLAPGVYTIDEVQPIEYGDGPEVVGTEGGNGTAVNDEISGIDLGSGVDATGYDFVESTGSISGTVVDDLGNPIPNVTITLIGTDDLGNAYDTVTTTDGNGDYTFEGLPSGDYTVTESQPTAYGDGGETAGSAGGDDSVDDVISAIPLAAGENSVDNNFDETTGSISGSVFEDLSNDAQYDAGEPGIAGVIITLSGTDVFGNPVDVATTTDANGNYIFDSLVAGDYTVTETQPAAYFDGQDDAGSAGGDTTINDEISSINLSGGEDAIEYDFGELELSTIAGTVFEDLDNDGVQDAGEVGIPGATITLTGTDYLGASILATITTDADGNYLFGSLLPGSYTVTETQPAGYVDGIDSAGTAGGTPGNDQVSSISLGAFTDAVDYNFGELPPSSISGSVVDDFGTPIEDVSIALSGTDDLGNPVSATTTTLADGSYSLTGLRPGDYTVTETQPVEYGDGPETAGSSGGDTSVNDIISSIVIVAGEDSINNNFVESTGTLSGTVFEDTNNNGVQDVGEVGIAGVTVDLAGTDDLGNTVAATTATDADGNYTFDGLVAGTYAITETQPTSHSDGIDSAGSEGGDDTSVNDEISGIVLGGGVDGADYNFGEIGLSSISGTVFEDLDNDGVQDAGEVGIAGVTVELSGTDDLGGPVAATTLTDADGGYVFDGLRPGSYTVAETQPTGYLDGIDSAGSEGGDDATVNDEISAIALPAFNDATGYDFGELSASSISGAVVDDFGNPIEGVMITLTGTDDVDNPVSLTTITDGSGSYTFEGLRPGDYTVTESQPVEYGDGGETAGTTGGDDSVDDVISGIVLPPATDSLDNNFDETTGSISGTVFEDADNDGQPDAGEAGIEGVTVTLSGTDDLGNLVNLTTVTDTDGEYTFDYLLSGTYAVVETQPVSHADGLDDAGSVGGDAATVNDEVSGVVLPAGIDATGYDFGELLLSSISGTVYEDLDNDGAQDVGEVGIAGVTVDLVGTDDLGEPVTATATTDADGGYIFGSLRPGEYTVTESQPVGFLDGIDSAGTVGGDDTTVNDVISGILLPAFTDVTGYDFAEIQPSLVSGSVVDDFGGPIEGVTITLTGTDDLANPVSVTTTTDGAGNYSFEGLRPGDYAVTETQPVGYGDGGESAGSTGGDDSVDDVISGIILVPGTDSVDNDFDETTGSLSGTVFEDLNNSGVQGVGESGIVGVFVTLSGINDLGEVVSDVAFTDADGAYSFDGLLSGVYVIDESQRPLYLDGIDTAGSAGGDDASVNDQISGIPLDPGEDATGYNFGEILPSSISGTVVDDSGNPIPDTTITLTGIDDLADPVLLTVATLADGSYSFEGLRPGDYTVTESQPVEYGDGGETAGSTGGDDSVDDVISGIVLVPGTDSVGNSFDETTGSISGTVFEDADNDGQPDAGEAGIEGVTVTLSGTDDLGNPVNLTTTTDVNGVYIFDSLLAGDYTVSESQPVSHADGLDDAGSVGGDATAVNDEISGIVLPGGVDAVGYDFGELSLSSISGTVFDDLDNDGVQDVGEAGIAGVTIDLSGTDDLGNPVTATATTDGDGEYIIGGLRPGEYTVTESQPVGFLDGIDSAGTVGGDDTTVNDVISGILLPAFTDVTGYDFAEVQPSLVSGTVVDDSGSPIPDTTITLTGTDDLADPVLVTVATLADGSYSFDGLRPGDYTVTETQPVGYGDGGETAGSTGGDDSVDDVISGIVLSPGTDSVGNDFDETTGSLSGTVFEDLNNDGVQDVGEVGIAGVTVELTGTDDLGNPVSLTTTTDTDGGYLFDSLLSGDYTVSETQPVGYLDGIDSVGTAGGSTSANDVVSAVALDPGQDALAYDFAEILPSSISGTVVDDFGIPIEGVAITLSGTDDRGVAVDLFVTTLADGSYSFEDLRPGDYTVTESQPVGFGDGGESAGSIGGDDSVDDVISGIVLPPGTDSVGNNFDETTGSISGTVFEDADNDGQPDAGEAGIEGVTVTLSGTDDLGNTVAATTMTDVNGGYTFDYLLSGTYVVVESQPVSHADGLDDAGSVGGDATAVNDEISGIVLPGGVDAVGYDFGELLLSSISGTVFDDLDNDGFQDLGEAGIAGVTVDLSGTDDLGNPVTATATTDADGDYTFSGLRPGDYTVTAAQPAGFLDGIDTAGSEGGDDVTVNDEISGILLPAFTDAVDYDFAEVQPSSVSGTVVDDFGNPIPDTTITLTGTDDLANPVSLTTTTDGAGNYSFEGLRPGDYTVTESQPVGYGDGGETAGSAGGDDSVDDLISGIVLVPGTDSVGNDFDETTGSISGTVFEDADNDGQPDVGEAGIEGVTVTLSGLDDLGNPVNLTTTTDTDGGYTFDYLLSGTYVVVESQPVSHADGLDDAGSVGGDATAVNDEISGIVLPGGVDAVGYDFGELSLSSISGTVFDDLNNNGVQDAGEVGIADVTVELSGTDDLGAAVTAAATTDVDGRYVFEGLRPGSYSVAETQPVGFLDGIDTAGSEGGDDTTVNDVISGILLPAFTDVTGYDFAEIQPSLVSGSVVDDFGGPIEGVTITLTGTDDLANPVSVTTTTDGAGNYSFEGLRPGDYAVTETQPVGYGDGGESAGSTGGDDSVDDVISGIILVPGTDSVDNDFDETTGSLSGTVFEDLNNSGVQGVGESGIVGVFVTLSGINDLGEVVSDVAFTDADGAYSFDGLLSGVYVIDESQRPLYLDGIDTAGSAGGDDASVNDQISGIPLDPGEDATGYNFGEILPSSISGTVVDDSGNPIPDTTITLTGTDDLADPVLLTVATLADGSYSFEGLRPGDYTVTETQPVGYGDGGETAGSAGGDDSVDDVISGIVLPPGTDSVGNSFDETTGSISGTVFEDADNDGQPDVGEAGIEGVTVTLSGLDDLGNPVNLTTTTDTDGGYTFDYLLSGTYVVVESQPVSHADGLDDAGSVGGDDVTVNDEISGIVLPGGVDAVGYDFGELSLSSISGTVFDDLNNNGVQDVGEAGIAGVTVELSGTDDLGSLVTITTTTDGDGEYIIGGLRPGDYTVTESQPTGFLDGIDSAGTAGGDSSVNDVISGILLPAFTDVTGYDFAEVQPSLVSGTVVDDSGSPIEGVTITLTGTDDLDGPVSLTTTTDGAGNYSFDDLRPGDYTVTETQPVGYGDGGESAGSAGGDDTVDDVISGIVLPPGTDSVDNSFDETTGSISGTVFEDLNNDGVQDVGEAGIEGVTVTLSGLDDLGNPVSLTATTGADGGYLFDSLLSGDYTVSETQPVEYLDGIDTAGGAGGDDASVNDQISGIPLDPGEGGIDYNFAELSGSSISGAVVDDFGNPIPNTTITLTGTDDLDNPVLLATTTDGAGDYSFESLRPGIYTITESQPVGYGDGGETAGSAGGDDTVDDVISGIILPPATDSVDNSFDETTGSMSGTVFEDVDNDGQPDAGEAGIVGVTITMTGLDDLGNNVSLSTVTDADGNYSFDYLIAGTYTVAETQPSGYSDGIDDPGSLGGDVSLNDQITVYVPGGIDAVEYDFGELNPSVISGSVFDDFGNPIPNVELTLTGTDDLGDPVTLTTTTNEMGGYVFQGLRPGIYTITESQPLGYGDGDEVAGTSGGDVSTDNVIANVPLDSVDGSTGNDFFETTSSISGTVFEDLNNDGQPDLNEAGIPGTTLALTGTDDLGNPVNLSTTTDAFGTYIFDNLLSGDYTVSETQTIGYEDGVDDVGTAGGDSSVNDVISAIPLDPGLDATEYDFGEILLSSLFGAVFGDLNNDGIQGTGELGIEGVEVTLTGIDDLDSSVAITVTTDADGIYGFGDLRPGTYTVTETQPVDYDDGIDTAGTEGGDATTVNDEISGVDLLPFVDGTGYTFAELVPASISGSVVDDFGNPIPDVEIMLTGTDDLGNPVTLVTTTDASGTYIFEDLRPGDYTVSQTQPVGYGDGGETAGTAGGDTSTDDVIADIIIGPGTVSTDNNFDETTGVISGAVFNDLDNGGEPDTDEPGIEGVEVTLTGTDDLGNPVSLITATDADGNYFFENLISGTYTVTETQPADYVDGIDDAGTAGGDDTTANDEISAVVLDGGELATDYDFGELIPSSISGSVGDDFGNPIPNVAITLTGTDDLGDPVSITVATDVLGEYVFEDLRPGDYTLTETQPVGYGDGDETAGTVGGDTSTNDVIADIMLASNTESTGNNFDETTGSLSGAVFHDRNGDGIQDPITGDPAVDEPGIAGVEITLTGTDDLGNPVLLTTTTDADGNYTFENMLSGTYTITETQPDPYLDGIETAGTAGGDTTVNDEISGVVVDPGVGVTGNNFAELGDIIAGTVWLDTNESGAVDPEERARLEGVVVELYDDEGTFVATVTTDESGNYAFPSVPAGDYTVVQLQPDEYGTTTPNSLDIVLPVGGISDVNFGEDPATISGVIWEDLNGNGIEDGANGNTEPRVEGVIITLRDVDGNAMATTTGPDGSYRFVDLPAGDYIVELVTPEGTVVTSPEVGGDDTVDSDFPYITTMVSITVTAGEDVEDVDGGIVEKNKDLAVEITADTTTAKVGDTVVYTLEGSNAGDAPITGGVEIVVTVPSGLSVTGTNSDHLCASGGGLVLEGAIGALTHDGCWEILVDGQTVTAIWTGDVLPGESPPVFTITTGVKGPGDLVVEASIGAVDGSAEVTYANNNDQVSVSVPAPKTPPVLAITGSETGRAVGTGLLLMSLGGAALLLERRRRHNLKT